MVGEYLTVMPDEALPIPRIANSSDFNVLRAVLQNKQDKLPAKTVFRLRELPAYGLPDVIFAPFLMVSKLFYSCVCMYHPYQKAIPVRLINTDGIVPYFILLLTEKGREEGISDCMQHIFRVQQDKEIRMKISLDLSESLLRRGAFGYVLVDEQEE